MATQTIIQDATWIDVFEGGQAFFRPSSASIIVQRDGQPDDVRPMGANQLYLSTLKAFAHAWTLTQDGINGHAMLTRDGETNSLGEALIGPQVAAFSGPSDIDETYGQQCVMLGWDGECIVAAIQTSLLTWDRVRIDAAGNVVSRLTQPITINGGQGTTQGFLWFYPARDPANDFVGWTDTHRSVTMDGITMLLPVTAGDLTVGQPVTGPQQVTGYISTPTMDQLNGPTSLFLNLACNLFPRVCVDGLGWRVSTSLLNNQAAIWLGTAAELPPYVGTEPLPPPVVIFTKPMLCGLYASPLKYGKKPPYPCQMMFLTSGDTPAQAREVYEGPLIAGLDKYDPKLCAGIYMSSPGPTWGPALQDCLATAKANGQRVWAYLDAPGAPFPQAMLDALDANAYPMLPGYALQGETVDRVLGRVARNMLLMDRPYVFVTPYYAPFLTVAQTWQLLNGLMKLANADKNCIGTAGFQVDRPQPAPYAFGPWELPVRAASTAPESWIYAPKSKPNTLAAMLALGSV